MKLAFKYVATVACLFVIMASTQGLFAICTENDNIFPIFQCGFTSWFAPAPTGTGPVTGTWWQLNYGNLNVANGTINAALEGTGITPPTPVTFSGNDAGMGGITLTEARFVIGGTPANPNPLIPAGASCVNYEDSWGEPGVDGCADNKRTSSAYDNDNLLNPYFGGTAGPGTYSTNYLIDYPVGFMLREGSGKFFAIAFLSSKSRGGSADDPTPGVFDLGEVVNGDPNPLTGQPDIIPWQPVPKPNVDSATFNASTAMLSLSWNNVRQISDAVSRPSPDRLVEVGGATGVGVANFGSLVRYQVETLALNTLPAGSVNPITGAIDPAVLAAATFVPQGPAIADQPDAVPKILHTLTVPRDTAIRIRTLIGKAPRTTVLSTANCRLGRCGDLGVEATPCTPGNCAVSAPLTIIGGALISERAIEMRAAKVKGSVVVGFRTTSEQTVTGIEILGVGNKGDFSIRSVSPQQGSTGVGADYEVTLGAGELKGVKSLKVRLNGPNFTSDPFPVE